MKIDIGNNYIHAEQSLARAIGISVSQVYKRFKWCD